MKRNLKIYFYSFFRNVLKKYILKKNKKKKFLIEIIFIKLLYFIQIILTFVI